LPWHIRAIAYMLSRVKSGGAVTMAWGLGTEPPAGSRGRVPGQGVRGGEAPLKLKAALQLC